MGEEIPISLATTAYGWTLLRSRPSLTNVTMKKSFAGHGFLAMKGQLYRIGHGATPTTMATRGLCSTLTCVSSSTLRLHFHAVQELISPETMVATNVIEETMFSATPPVAGLQIKKLPWPWLSLPVNVKREGLTMTTGHSSVPSVLHGKQQPPMVMATSRSLHCRAPQRSHRLLYRRRLRLFYRQQLQLIYKLNRQQHHPQLTRLSHQ